mmetsp:Transcript_15371/g.13429  ORF Transcript_15371/g.13429 Transcript_15371/m.13429 type:complete len:216 (+) Transcript_15371:15-662(+)
MLSPYLSKLNNKKIILASGSVARKAILEQAGLEIIVSPSSFAEDLDKTGLTHKEYVKSTSEHKLLNKIEELKSNGEKADIIIVGDTIISFENEIIEKAEDEADAINILTKLSGESHSVLSSAYIAFLDEDLEILYKENIFNSTKVEFYHFGEDVIAEYMKTGEAYGKAGCYGIQGTAATWIKNMDGCYYSVWGFPLSQFCVKMVEMINITGFLDE